MIHHNETAGKIWEKDKKRIDILNENNYIVYVVWEDEWLNDKNDILDNVKKLIETELKIKPIHNMKYGGKVGGRK